MPAEGSSGGPHPATGSGHHDFLSALRESGPIAWVGDLGAWVVTTREMSVAVLRDAGTFTVDHDDFSTRRVVGPSMLSRDGAEHRRHRSPFAPGFRVRAVQENLGEWVAGEVDSIVSDLGSRGSGDLRALLAAPLAGRVMRRVLGLEDVSLDELTDWNASITNAIDEVTLGTPVPESGKRAFEELLDTVSKTMVRGGGLLGNAPAKGSLTVDEVAANVAVLLIGGVVTSEGAIATCLHHLLTHPEILERLREDPGLLEQAIDESMRLEPAAAFVDRYATRDVDLGDVKMEAGDLVRVSISAANRDPDVFPNPKVFDIERANAGDHLAFAQGPHACLGIHVARLETRIAIGAVVRRLDGLESVAEAPAPGGLIFRAPPSVPAVWAGDLGILS